MILLAHVGLLLVAVGGAPPLIDGADIERIWVGLAQAPSAGDEVSRAIDENLQRAWMEMNNGIR